MRCKLDPGLIAPRFQNFNLMKDIFAFKLNLVSDLAPPYVEPFRYVFVEKFVPAERLTPILNDFPEVGLCKLDPSLKAHGFKS